MKENRNLSIEALRGIGCIMVVVFHLIYRYTDIYQKDYQLPVFIDFWDKIQLNLGLLGVILFFTISFFFIPKTNNCNSKIDTLFIKKWYRLWMPYAISIVITFLHHNF